MNCSIVFSQIYNNDIISMQLRQLPPIYSDTTISSKILIEDTKYKAYVEIEETEESITDIDVLLNSSIIGSCHKSDFSKGNRDILLCPINFLDSLPGDSQPFLLQYDLIYVSINIKYENRNQWLYSDYHLCLSSIEENTQNVERMINALLVFDDEEINRWILTTDSSSVSGSGLIEGGLEKHSYKSHTSFVQMLEQINSCYQQWLPYFRNRAKHTISNSINCVSYNKVRSVSNSDFEWLMQNSVQLSAVNMTTGVLFEGQHYLPQQIRTRQQIKDWDVYENRIVLSFLQYVCHKSKEIKNSLNENVENEKRILEKIIRVSHVSGKAPIISIKKFQLSHYQMILTKVELLQISLYRMFQQYRETLKCAEIKFNALPRKTKTFQEVDAYNRIFDLIVKWFDFGEFKLQRESLLMHIKKLDKLFEYYCLHVLLFLFKHNGFVPQQNSNAIESHHYSPDDGSDPNEYDIANTFRLEKEGMVITLYYQPVVFSYKYENDITLFKTSTLGKASPKPYLTPDFIIKVSKDDSQPSYIIMDAKYSTRKNIKLNALENTLHKYYCQLDSVDPESKPIKALWLLQGRVDDQTPLFCFMGTPIAQKLSLGIVSVNTKEESAKHLWNALQKAILTVP